MPTIGYRALWLVLALVLLTGAGELPKELRRGINITNWLRFPPNREPGALRTYLSDAELRTLTRDGFSFVRLPVQPDLLASPAVLADVIGRVQRQGLATVVALFPAGWHLETDPADQAKLLATWRTLAPVLARFAPALTFPEILNEPVFANDPQGWARLQHQALISIRAILPANAIVLTGAGWGGVDGLLSLVPEPDRNVIYSFHFYEPAELTALGAYRRDIDPSAMALLPFPVTDIRQCEAVADSARDAQTAGLARFYCQEHWDVARVTERIEAVGEWARSHNVPIIAGEFGASERLNPAARLAWLATVRTACEQRQFGWALWGYDDSMGFGLHPPRDPRPLDEVMLHALGFRLGNAE